MVLSCRKVACGRFIHATWPAALGDDVPGAGSRRGVGARGTQVVVEPAGRHLLHLVGHWQRAVGAAGPADSVGDHPAYYGVVVDGVILVSGAEVEDPPGAPVEAASGPEYLSAGEARDEDELVRLRDVEELAVHLLCLDLEHRRDPLCYAVG